MSRIKRLWREPLVHFLLIGAALFLVFGVKQGSNPRARNRIVVDASQVDQLTAQFTRTWMRPPTAAELKGLVASYVRDEVYYREALAMGLDQDDPVIRQRMRQKLEFLLEDLAAEDPSDADLTAFLQAHPDRFRSGPRISFEQCFLDPEKHRDLLADAQDMLAQLSAGVSPDSIGDSTLLPSEFKLATQADIGSAFGELFASEVGKLAPGAWTGPIYSGLGGHLVRVTERREGRLPELAAVRAQVEGAYLAQRRQQLNEAAYQRLLESYEVVIEPAASGRAADAAPTETAQVQPPR